MVEFLLWLAAVAFVAFGFKMYQGRQYLKNLDVPYEEQMRILRDCKGMPEHVELDNYIDSGAYALIVIMLCLFSAGIIWFITWI